VAVGLVFTVGVLGIDWSSFGWIAAALSVGLGFGLQEIVANFVCGIILLFERPIRVGDVVTVSGTTGLVSKIRIRATTITNYDRQEFIVPNKEFITGTLLNWTLSTTLNRIVMVVGVAYGSDTRRVRNLLLEICNGHPDVLQDPAASAIFDGFGDSTLNFTVRTYLASMEDRLDVTNELHHQIHERFAAEGIEIAFPQMDLHLRSIDPGFQIGSGQIPEPGKTSLYRNCLGSKLRCRFCFLYLTVDGGRRVASWQSDYGSASRDKELKEPDENSRWWGRLAIAIRPT
jgi:potassium efflux system protein